MLRPMLAFLTHPGFWAVILPFAVALATGLAAWRFLGPPLSALAAGAGLGLGYVAALLAGGGLPTFPPPSGVGALAYWTLLAVAAGLGLDRMRARAVPARAAALGPATAALGGLFALLAAWWALGPAPAEDRTLWFLWTALPILAGGPVLMVRLHAVAGRPGGPANTAVMGLFLAAGLALVANVADTPTDTALALALGAALAGFLVGPVLVARVGFGSTALLALGTVLVFLAVRLGWHSPAPWAAVAVLGMIPFADSVSDRLPLGPVLGRPALKAVARPLILSALCLSVLALAAVVALAGVSI